MTHQGTLFGAPNVFGDLQPLARRTDPAASHRAAAKQIAGNKVASGSSIILDILRRTGRPCTYREIWAAANDAEQAKLREPNTIAKRLTVLERRGLVRTGVERICTVGGSEARAWELADPPQGRD